MLWERSERDFRTHPAAASIAAGLAVTLHDLLAVDAGEARRTGAGVAALAGVHAPGLVDAGLVVCAVVQVCENKGAAASASSPPHVIFAVGSVAAEENGLHTLVAKDAPPAFLAGALPRLFTGTMFAGRMGFTHVTKESLPALSAPVDTFNNKTF